jgi:hypothetical protein
MAAQQAELLRRRIITPKLRLSYPHLFTPKKRDDDDEEPKFSTAMIFEAGTDLKAMKAVALEVAQSRWQNAADLIRSGKVRWPFRDDAEEVADKGYPEGCTFMNANSKTRPGVVNALTEVVTDPDEAYAGRYAKISLTAYTYDVKGNRGVTFGLNNVQLLEHGERLDGRRNPADEFEVEEGALSDLSDMEEEEFVGTETGETDALSDLVS